MLEPRPMLHCAVLAAILLLASGCAIDCPEGSRQTDDGCEPVGTDGGALADGAAAVDAGEDDRDGSGAGDDDAGPRPEDAGTDAGTDAGCELQTVYADADGDGWGDDATEEETCDPEPDTVARGGDCDDGNEDRSPGALEVCNGIDDDCSDGPDDIFPCSIADTLDCVTDCGSAGTRGCDACQSLTACRPPLETCNYVDDDCDGLVDEELEGLIGDAIVISEDDGDLPGVDWTGAAFAISYASASGQVDTAAWIALVEPGGGIALAPTLVSGLASAATDVAWGGGALFVAASRNAEGLYGAEIDPETGIVLHDLSTDPAGSVGLIDLTGTDLGAIAVFWTKGAAGMAVQRWDAGAGNVSERERVGNILWLPDSVPSADGQGAVVAVGNDETSEVEIFTLDAEGDVTAGPTQLSSSGGTAGGVALGRGAGAFMVVYATGPPDGAAYALPLDSNLSPGQAVQIAASGYVGTDGLASSGQDYLVVLSYRDDAAMDLLRISPDGASSGAPVRISDVASPFVRLVWAGDRYGIVWSGTTGDQETRIMLQEYGCAQGG